MWKIKYSLAWNFIFHFIINKWKHDKYEKIILKLILKIKIRDLFEILSRIGISLAMYSFLLKIGPFEKNVDLLKFLDKEIIDFLRKIRKNNGK